MLRFVPFSVGDDGTSSDVMYADHDASPFRRDSAGRRNHTSKCGALLLVPDSWWSYLPLERRSHSELEVTVIRA